VTSSSRVSTRPASLLFAVAISSALVFALSVAAQAHAVLTVGPYTLALGWKVEPAYVGQLNAVQLIVKDASGGAITDIGPSDLTVVVTLGDDSSPPMALAPGYDEDTRLGTPGDYEAPLIPTVPGDYTFHLSGTVHGTAVDQTVTSGDTTFSSVTGAEQIQFPTTEPAVGDLAARLDRVDARAGAVAASSDSDANRALIVGIVLGGIALAVALVALWRTRRRA
jgi:hypothetical protein